MTIIFYFELSLKKIKQLLFNLLFLIILTGCSSADDSFELKNGDLLFSVGAEGSSFTEAIKNSTAGLGEIPFSHVGIVSIEDNEVIVIEATVSDGVVRTNLQDFFDVAASSKDKTLITVGRLNKDLQYSIPEALERANLHLGNDYDLFYDESNDSFYCSELVRFAFVDSTGSYIFEPLSMTFKNKETGVTDPYWIDHFEKLNAPIPEGEPGTNPSDMAKSNYIEIVYSYF